jgi:lysyl-tRNA synthetase class II
VLRFALPIGRITSIRRHGSYFMFLDIVNQFETIQALVNWKSVENNSRLTVKKFKLFSKLIDRGDHVCKRCPLLVSHHPSTSAPV